MDIKISKKHIDVTRFLKDEDYLSYIKITRDGIYATNGAKLIFNPHYEVIDLDESIYISKKEIEAILKNISKNQDFFFLRKEEDLKYYAFVPTSGSELKIEIKNDIKDDDFPPVKEKLFEFNNAGYSFCVCLEVSQVKDIMDYLWKYRDTRDYHYINMSFTNDDTKQIKINDSKSTIYFLPCKKS